MTMVDIADAERKIAERMDPNATGAVELSQQAGGLGFSNVGEAMQFAKLMAISQFAVPKHLRGNVGACMAIITRAVEWNFSPFAVASKSYCVNDALAFESQLIQAVILRRAPIKGRFTFAFTGEGERRKCTVTAALKDGGTVDYTSPEVGKIPVKNSPLWKNDPDQQLCYYSGRALCRRHFPDVLLGIYTPEDLYLEPRRGPEHARDVTPTKAPDAAGDNADPPHDPETGEITGAVGCHVPPSPGDGSETGGRFIPDADAEQHEERAAGIPEHWPTMDEGTQKLLDKARAKATNGAAAFNRWEKGLSIPESVSLEPHLEALRKAAAAADGAPA